MLCIILWKKIFQTYIKLDSNIYEILENYNNKECKISNEYNCSYDDYFYLHHRNEPRGIGGIFFDYKKENWDRDFAFVRDVGIAFSYLFKEIIAKKFKKRWKKKDKLIQNKK